MWSRIVGRALIAGLSLVPLLSPVLSQPAHALPALGQDVCPEPNDTFQAACYLGPGADANGFISNANDIDAYRIEVLDFNTDVHVELKMPAAYKVELANWNGDVIASSSAGQDGQVIDTTVPIPGSYYMFVHSANGQSSDSQPYTIGRSLAYPGSKIPDVLFSSEFRQGAQDAIEGDTQYATHSEDGGRYTIAMKVPGEAEDPSQAWWTGFGPELTDFTMTVDARVANGTDAGAQIFFRHVDDDNTYFTTIDAKDGQVKLSKKVGGELTGTDWISTDAVNTGGGVNRVVIRCFHDEILVNVNGEDVFNVSDDSFTKGRIGIGAIAWDQPPVLNFDNIIITTPTEG
jgi:hypothetical protein